MQSKAKFIARAAIIAALYATITYLQNAILPGSASWAIQFRVSEALCVLAFFTPSAIAGLSAGCLFFNLGMAPALPFDAVIGTLATFLSCVLMYLTRRVKIKGYPLLGMLAPAVFNGLLLGWEFSFSVGGGFLLNASYVALGEAAVVLLPGSFLHYALLSRRVQL